MDNNEILMNDYACEFAQSTATIECNIDSGAKGGVGKLLSVAASVKSAKVDKNGDSAKVTATLNCKVVFLNKAGEFDSFDYLCDFTQAVSMDNNEHSLQEYNHLWAVCGVVDIDSNVAGEMIKVQSVVDIKLFGILTAQVECMADSDSQAICKKADIAAQSLINISMQNFEIEESFDTGCTVEKILLSDVNALVNNAKSMDGKCLVSGNICGTLCYLSEGVVTCKNFNTPFSEEVDCEGMLEGDKANVLVSSCDCKIILTGMEGENVILVQTQVELRIDCFRLEDKKIVTDAFLTDFEIEMEDENCEFGTIDKTYNLFDKIVGTAEVGEEMTSVAKVICTSLSRNILVNTYYDDGKIVVEGVLAVNVVYLNVEDNPQSILIELPYSLQFDEQIDGVNRKLYAEAIVDNLFAKIKRDREFEVTANISITVTSTVKTSFKAIKNIMITDIKKANKFGITVYNCVEGDCLWDVAKTIGASEEEIAMQNADLEGDLSGRKIVFYRQINS